MNKSVDHCFPTVTPNMKSTWDGYPVPSELKPSDREGKNHVLLLHRFHIFDWKLLGAAEPSVHAAVIFASEKRVSPRPRNRYRTQHLAGPWKSYQQDLPTNQAIEIPLFGTVLPH